MSEAVTSHAAHVLRNRAAWAGWARNYVGAANGAERRNPPGRLGDPGVSFRRGETMAKTFRQLAGAAMQTTTGITPEEARARLATDPHVLLVDMLDLADRKALGQPEGTVPIAVGMLALRADHEVPEHLRDARLQDRDRPIITICGNGPVSAIGAQTLREMGFTDVAYVAGGRVAWAQAGFPLVPPTDG